MKPVRIETAGKGFWGAIAMWLLGGRTWEIVKDWHYYNRWRKLRHTERDLYSTEHQCRSSWHLGCLLLESY